MAECSPNIHLICLAPFDLNALKQFLALYQTVLAKETDIVTKHQVPLFDH